MNKVILMGRLVRDPEIKWTRSVEDSKKYANYTLAVNRRFKREGQQDADFINCIAWGAQAEFAEKFMRKGGLFSIVGRLNVRSWEDNEGKKCWNTTVVVEENYFAESKATAESRSGQSKPAAEQSGKPADSQNGKQMGLAENDGFYPIEEGIEDDDLPF